MMSFSFVLIGLITMTMSYNYYPKPAPQPPALPRLRDLDPRLVKDLIKDIRHRIDQFQRPVDTETTPAEPKTLIAGLARLAILDCVGGCNGCIDPNADKIGGAEFASVLPIEQVYRNKRRIIVRKSALSADDGQTIVYDTASVVKDNWNGNPSRRRWNHPHYGISRADIWMLAATIGIEYGVELAYKESGRKLRPKQYKNVCIRKYYGSGIELPVNHWYRYNYHYNRKIDCVDIPYYIGRKDCVTSPWVNQDLITEIFSNNPFFNFDELSNFFGAGFGFTRPQQTIAFMGAHTLGRGHRRRPRSTLDPNLNCCGGTGFRGPWKRPTFTFSNAYFKQIRDGFHILVPANTQRSPSDTDFNLYRSDLNWLNALPTGNILVGFNLNVDMSLYLDIDPEEGTGNVTCLHPNIFDELQRPGAIRPILDRLIPDKTLPKCQRQPVAKRTFDTYTRDNIRFLYDFMEVWEIMITAGALRPEVGYGNGYGNGYHYKTNQEEKKLNDNDFGIFIVVLSTCLIFIIFGAIMLGRYCYLKKKETKKDKEMEMANVVSKPISPKETDGTEIKTLDDEHST